MKKLALLLAATTAATLFLRTRWTVVRVAGESMLPTLKDGDLVLASRHKTPGKGDVVVLNRPAGPIQIPAGAQAVAGETGSTPSTPLIKRVTATAGEKMPRGIPGGPVVPPDHVVVLSDNDGLDSRLFGPIPRTAITAVVIRALR